MLSNSNFWLSFFKFVVRVQDIALLQSIWRHYILNIVSVEIAAYTKVQLHLACFVIHG